MVVVDFVGFTNPGAGGFTFTSVVLDSWTPLQYPLFYH